MDWTMVLAMVGSNALIAVAFSVDSWRRIRRIGTMRAHERDEAERMEQKYHEHEMERMRFHHKNQMDLIAKVKDDKEPWQE